MLTQAAHYGTVATVLADAKLQLATDSPPTHETLKWCGAANATNATVASWKKSSEEAHENTLEVV